MKVVSIWTTNLCNMKCKYCYEHQDKQDKNLEKDICDEKSFEFMKKFLEGTEDVLVHFHGGEPLLKHTIIEKYIKFVEENKSSNIEYNMTTNLTVLTPKILNLLEKYFKKTLSISIDGNRETHNHNRTFRDGSGTYDIVSKNVNMLLHAGFSLKARKTLSVDRVDYLYKDIIHLIQMGFSKVDCNIDIFDSSWNKENMEKQLHQILKLKNNLNENDRNKISFFDKINLIRKKYACVIGKKSFHIYCDGKIYPCAYVVGQEKMSIGSLHSGFDELKIKKLNQINRYKNEICIDCKFSNYCIGERCKLVNFITTGEYYIPHPTNCLLNSMTYKLYKSL